MRRNVSSHHARQSSGLVQLMMMTCCTFGLSGCAMDTNCMFYISCQVWGRCFSSAQASEMTGGANLLRGIVLQPVYFVLVQMAFPQS